MATKPPPGTKYIVRAKYRGRTFVYHFSNGKDAQAKVVKLQKENFTNVELKNI